MLNSIDILSFILSFFILYFAFNLFTKLRHQDVFRERLKGLLEYRERLLQEDISSQPRIYERKQDQKLPWLRKIVDKVLRTGEEEKEKLKRLFDKAGIKATNAYLMYGIAKTIMIFPPAIIVGFIVFHYTQINILFKIIAIVVAALFGSFLVDFILQRLSFIRQEKIRKAFPEALDLMVICTEAGLSLTATVQRVAREISQVSSDLGFELALLSIELNMLPDRRRALQNFSDRMDSPYFKSIIANIIQAEQYGTPIAQTMRTIAEQFRQDRLVEAEERAAKLPVLLTLPMMGLIFPCIYIVILGPATLNILKSLKYW